MASLGTLTLNITANLRGFTRGMKTVGAVIAKNQQAFQSLRNGSAVVSASLGLLGAASIRTAAEFESSMTRVSAIAGDNLDETGEAFDSLSKAAINMASTSEFSAREVAKGMQFMATAGNDAADILERIPAVVDLASAGMLDLGTAANISTNIIAGFGLEASELGRATDVMVKAFTSANTDLVQLGEAFKFVGPIAKAAGVDFEEVTAALGFLGNAGIQASVAGTAVRGAIVKLLKPSEKAAKIFRDLGINVKTSEGKLRPFADILDDLGPIAGDAGKIIEVFGLRAGPGMAALLAIGGEKLREFTRLLKDSAGIAKSLREKQIDTLSGSFKILASNVEAVSIKFGDELGPSVRSVVDTLSDILKFVQRLTPGFKKLIVAVIALTFALSTLLTVFALLGLAIPGVTALMALFSTAVTATVIPALAKMAVALGLIFLKVTAVLAVLGAVAAAAFVAGVGIQKALEGKKFDLVVEVKASFGRLKGALADLFVVSSEDVEKTIKKAGDGLADTLEKQNDAMAKIVASAKEALKKQNDAQEKLIAAQERLAARTLDFSSELEQQVAKSAGADLGSTLQAFADVMNDVTANTAEAFETAIATTLDFSSAMDKAFVAAKTGPAIQAAAVKAGVADPEKKPLGIKEAGVDFAKRITGSLGDSGRVIQSAVQGFAAGGPFVAMFAAIFEILSATEGFDQIIQSLNSLFQDIVVSAEPLIKIILPIIQLFSGVSSVLTNFLAPILTILGGVLTAIVKVILLTLFPFLLLEEKFGFLADATEGMIDGLETVVDAINAFLRFIGEEEISIRDTTTSTEQTSFSLGGLGDSADDASNAMGNVSKSMVKLGEELTNVPTILKTAALRFEATAGAIDGAAAMAPAVAADGGNVVQGDDNRQVTFQIIAEEASAEAIALAIQANKTFQNFLGTGSPLGDVNRGFAHGMAR